VEQLKNQANLRKQTTEIKYLLQILGLSTFYLLLLLQQSDHTPVVISLNKL